MSNNTNCSPSDTLSIPCRLDDSFKEHHSYLYTTSMACFIVILTLSPVTVIGNALILAAIWKKTFQRTPFHIILSGLAFTDLCSGLFAQTLIGTASLLTFFNPGLSIVRPSPTWTILAVGFVSGVYFGDIALLIITLMSIERWLHMSRRALLTGWRGRCITFTLLLLIPIPLVYFTTLDFIKENTRYEVSITIAVQMVFGYLITSVAYFKVFQIIRQHQQQVRGNQSSQNFGQPAINLEKYKKSLVTILYILALFSISFLPMVVSLFMLFHLGLNIETGTVYSVALVLLFLSSSLNPFLYLWRMNDIRNGVKQLFRIHG